MDPRTNPADDVCVAPIDAPTTDPDREDPTMKAPYDCTLHRDGDVSYWNVFTQTWERCDALSLFDADAIMASLPERDRVRIEKAAAAQAARAQS